MNKIRKVVISVVMSFAMAVCMTSTGAGVKAVSSQDEGISPQSEFQVGVPYTKSDKRGKITAVFTNQSTLVITYTNLTDKNRLVEMDVTTSKKTFKQRSFTVGGDGGVHSESYGITVNDGRIEIIVYPHTSTSPSSGYIDALRAILQ